MTKLFKHILSTSALLLASSILSFAQTTQKISFKTTDRGVEKSIKDWGIDATWINLYNAKASSKNAGDQIDFIRIGFYLHKPTNDDGSLSKGQIKLLDEALHFVHLVDKKMPIMLSPNNEKGIIDWYKEPDGSANVKRWYNVMIKTKEYVESKGHKVISVEAFNEPDWKNWNMGKKDDFNELLKMCKDWGVLRVGPSTLSANSAPAWYDKIRRNIEVGGTHTLGGCSMTQYVDFLKKAKRNRKTFMNPEVHSLVEVIVGAEEGMDSVCWWDQINKGRAAFMKACQGTRIAYEAVKDNWSAGCVYRGPDNVLYGFASTNERTNGKETKYKFICSDEDVTYYPSGDLKKGIFKKRGEPYEIQAKVEGEGKKSITKWFTIVPTKK